MYAGREGCVEAEIGGFVADGINAKGELIEVQTGNFGALQKKIFSFAAMKKKIKIIHPIAVTKYIEVFNTDNINISRRKSPRKGNPHDIFFALVYAPELPLVSGVTIELALLDVIEERVADGKGSWRRKYVSIRNRKITAYRERITLKKPSDYLRFVPFSKKEDFTVSLLKEKAGIRANLARKTLYVLEKIGVVQKVGKLRNAHIYRLTAK